MESRYRIITLKGNERNSRIVRVQFTINSRDRTSRKLNADCPTFFKLFESVQAHRTLKLFGRYFKLRCTILDSQFSLKWIFDNSIFFFCRRYLTNAFVSFTRTIRVITVSEHRIFRLRFVEIHESL